MTARGGWLPVRPRERLRAAADEAFTDRGIRSMSIEAISALANVPKSGFYRHFATKDDLVLDYVTRASTRFREALLAVDAAFPVESERVKALLVTAADNSIMLNAAAEYRSADPRLTLLFSRHRQWVRQWLINQLLRAGVDSAAFVALELAALYDAYTRETGESVERHQVRSVYETVVDRAFASISRDAGVTRR